MATRNRSASPQSYPRGDDGLLDESTLVQHTKVLTRDEIKAIIAQAIKDANSKSRREIVNIPSVATKEEKDAIYKREGRELFKYFKQYSGDPAETAHQVHTKNYRDVGIEAFRNQLLQRGRMNSGWRYQFLVVGCAKESGRFAKMSDVGVSPPLDFIAIMEFRDRKRYSTPLNLYVSVKNRSNTMGGADWPDAITALEAIAVNDKNRIGPYCCVFGIAMDRGQRSIKRTKGGSTHSVNTEIWKSDYFWPFFTNLSYEDVMMLVLEVLESVEIPDEELPTQIEVPDEVLTAFGERCRTQGLIDELGNFNDARRLVRFFCNPLPRIKKPKKQKPKTKTTPPITHRMVTVDGKVTFVPVKEAHDDSDEAANATKK